MTRGVHLYTNTIDRNATDATRITDGPNSELPRRSYHIAFFMGSDLFSHLILSKLVHRLIAPGHTPLYFGLPTKPKRRELSQHLTYRN